jgi:hypothetical protein
MEVSKLGVVFVCTSHQRLDCFSDFFNDFNQLLERLVVDARVIAWWCRAEFITIACVMVWVVWWQVWIDSSPSRTSDPSKIFRGELFSTQ